MSKVLILTAFYRHEKQFPRYINSLQCSKPENVKVCIRFDGKEHFNSAMLINFVNGLPGLPEIIYEMSDENQGAYRTFGRLTEVAREHDSYDYVMVLEGDDYLAPGFIEKTTKFLDNNPDYGAVHTDVRFVDPEGNIIDEAHWKQHGRYDNNGNHTFDMPSGWIREELIKNNFIMTCSCLMRREAFLKHNNLAFFQKLKLPMSDYPLMLSMSKEYQIGYIPKVLSNYTVNPAGASNNVEKRAAFVEATLRLQSYARTTLI